MQPGLREHFVDMMPRLQAERELELAVVVRTAQAEQDSYENMINRWLALSEGKEIDVDIDARGRPITDSLDDFIGFVHFDQATMQRYGQALEP